MSFRLYDSHCCLTPSCSNPTFPAGYLFYKGAKKYAELVAWECQKEARDQGAEWPLATMNCVMIWGPPSK